MVASRGACLALSLATWLVAGPANAVIYGDDDRVEIADLDDDEIRAAAARVAALVVDEPMQSWGEEQQLCDSVRFAEQPVVARCGAVLMDADLVLTAGHCARMCSLSRIVFGDDDSYACTDVVADHIADDVDFAWLRLDRPVLGIEPALARREPASIGESLTLLSFPGGIPMKADQGGVVTSRGEASFRTNHDAFAGSSGGPLLDATGAVVGILGGGAPDFVETPAGCFEPFVIDADDGLERATDTATAIASLPSQTTVAHSCATRLVPRGRDDRSTQGWWLLMMCFIRRRCRPPAQNRWARLTSSPIRAARAARPGNPRSPGRSRAGDPLAGSAGRDRR